MTFRHKIASIHDHPAFVILWMLSLAGLAAISLNAWSNDRMDTSIACSLAAAAIVALIVWTNQIATSVEG